MRYNAVELSTKRVSKRSSNRIADEASASYSVRLSNTHLRCEFFQISHSLLFSSTPL